MMLPSARSRRRTRHPVFSAPSIGIVQLLGPDRVAMSTSFQSADAVALGALKTLSWSVTGYLMHSAEPDPPPLHHHRLPRCSRVQRDCYILSTRLDSDFCWKGIHAWQANKAWLKTNPYQKCVLAVQQWCDGDDNAAAADRVRRRCNNNDDDKKYINNNSNSTTTQYVKSKTPHTHWQNTSLE